MTIVFAALMIRGKLFRTVPIKEIPQKDDIIELRRKDSLGIGVQRFYVNSVKHIINENEKYFEHVIELNVSEL